MAQVNKRITPKKLALGAGALIAAAFCVNLLLSPPAVVQLDAASMSLLTTDGTFRTVQGKGEHTIHVFLSTECSFCRKIEPELERLENVTVIRYMLPGGSDVGRKRALDVWCAEDQVKAWKNVAAGLPTTPAKCNGVALENNRVLAGRLGLTSTPSIIYGNGHVSAGMLSSGEITERMTKATTR